MSSKFEELRKRLHGVKRQNEESSDFDEICVCPYCGYSKLIVDHATGQIICPNCGSVIEEKLPDVTRPEYRIFGNNEEDIERMHYERFSSKVDYIAHAAKIFMKYRSTIEKLFNIDLSNIDVARFNEIAEKTRWGYRAIGNYIKFKAVICSKEGLNNNQCAKIFGIIWSIINYVKYVENKGTRHIEAKLQNEVKSLEEIEEMLNKALVAIENIDLENDDNNVIIEDSDNIDLWINELLTKIDLAIAKVEDVEREIVNLLMEFFIDRVLSLVFP